VFSQHWGLSFLWFCGWRMCVVCVGGTRCHSFASPSLCCNTTCLPAWHRSWVCGFVSGWRSEKVQAAVSTYITGAKVRLLSIKWHLLSNAVNSKNCTSTSQSKAVPNSCCMEQHMSQKSSCATLTWGRFMLTWVRFYTGYSLSGRGRWEGGGAVLPHIPLRVLPYLQCLKPTQA